jgi:hypothetical protein
LASERTAKIVVEILLDSENDGISYFQLTEKAQIELGCPIYAADMRPVIDMLLDEDEIYFSHSFIYLTIKGLMLYG